MILKRLKNLFSGERTDFNSELESLRKENVLLKKRLSQSQKNIDHMKAIVAKIPDGMQGYGMMLVFEKGEAVQKPLKSKKDILDVIEKAENGELEIANIGSFSSTINLE